MADEVELEVKENLLKKAPPHAMGGGLTIPLLPRKNNEVFAERGNNAPADLYDAILYREEDLKRFGRLYPHHYQLLKRMIDAAKIIHEYVSLPPGADNEGDYPPSFSFDKYWEIANLTTDALKDPAIFFKNDNAERYLRYAKEESKISPQSPVSRAMLVFLGITMTVAFVMLAVASCGFATPLAAIGLTIVLSKIGAALYGIGAGLSLAGGFFAGFSKNPLTKNMQTVHDSAKALNALKDKPLPKSDFSGEYAKLAVVKPK